LRDLPENIEKVVVFDPFSTVFVRSREGRALPTTLAFGARDHFFRAFARASVSYKIFDIMAIARTFEKHRKKALFWSKSDFFEISVRYRRLWRLRLVTIFCGLPLAHP